MKLRDVAKAAGLSVAAVSRFLNNSLLLPADTVGRIEAAIAQLGYRPNPHARRLSLGRSETIGLIIPDIVNPFFALLADAVEQAAEESGTSLLLCATRNRPARELQDLTRLGHRHADGLIFITNHRDDGSLAKAINAAGNVVLLDEDVADAEAPKLFADNRHGGLLAAQHLLDAGHRRLAFLGGPRGLLSTTERYAGFAEAIARTGGTARIVFEDYGDYSAVQGYTAAGRLLDAVDPATAVFATSDETALGVMQAARSRLVDVPGKLSLIAFDDVSPLHLMGPPLTAIRQPVAEMGRRGVRALLDCIGGAPMPVQPHRLSVELVERASVAPPFRRRTPRMSTKKLGRS